MSVKTVLLIIAIILFLLGIVSDQLYIYTKNKYIKAIERQNKYMAETINKTCDLIKLEKPMIDAALTNWKREGVTTDE